MSVFIKSKGIKILIDPGVCLAPYRFGYPPHPIELERMSRHWSSIVKHAKKSEVLIVTHYHYDHYNPSEDLEIYKGKTVLIKHPTENINRSQKIRANTFLEKIQDLSKKLEYSDGREFEFRKTKIVFSKAVYHGTSPKLGYVTEVLVDDGEFRFIHTSDVQGPSLREQVDFILQKKPNLVLIDGPMTYMLGFRYSYASLNASIENLIKILDACPLDAMILEHHFLRELKWKERIPMVFKEAEKRRIPLETAADYLKKPIELLEAKRTELYRKYPAEKKPFPLGE